MPLRKLFAATIFLLLTAPVYATTYYVSPTGNDSSSGTSTALPWKTVDKVSNASLRSGDVVSFLRGGVWREMLYTQASGVTFTAYGTGNRPVLSGANLFSSGWVKATAANVWTNPIGTTAPTQVWFNGVLGTKVASAAAVLAPLQWFYKGSTLTVYSAASLLGTAATTADIEAAQRDAGIVINNVSSITVEHMAFVNSGGVGICLCDSGNSGSETFTDDVVSGALDEAFSVGSGTPVIATSELINSGIGLNVYGGNGFTLNGSVISGNAGVAVTVWGTNGIGTIESSTITGNSTQSPDTDIIDNYSNYALNVSSSILLPNPYEPALYNYYGITDAGHNYYQSPLFKTRAAQLIVVPFIDDYNNLAVAQAVAGVAKTFGCTLSYALNTKLVTPTDWQTIAALQTAGTEIVAHTRSHSDLANNNVFSIQYTGTATKATMTINQTTGKLQTFLNGSTTPDLNLDLTNTWNGVIDVLSLIPAGSPYTVTIQLNQNYFTPINLAAVSAVNIKTAAYMVTAGTNYLNWEINGAEADLVANLPGYKVQAFATPFTSSNVTVENQIRSAGFISNRNGLLNTDSSPDGNWLFSTLDVYNMGAEWLPFAYDATQPASSVGALVEGLGAGGGVMAVYSHGYDEFTLQNWTDLFTNLKAVGATCMTMSQANASVESHSTLVPDGTKKNWVQSVPLAPNYSPTSLSPAAGADLVQ
jgi:hypothetical protein